MSQISYGALIRKDPTRDQDVENCPHAEEPFPERRLRLPDIAASLKCEPVSYIKQAQSKHL